VVRAEVWPLFSLTPDFVSVAGTVSVLRSTRDRATAPNLYGDSGGTSPRRVTAAVPRHSLRGRSRYSCVPSSVTIQKATGSLPEGGVPFGSAGGWGGSSGRSLLWLRARGLAGVGRIWDGHRPSPLSWDSVTLIPFVPRPTGGPRRAFKTTAVERYGRGRRPIKAAGCLGGPGPQRRSRCSLMAWGRRKG